MAPFRPANLNKRAYPGNASVIGPTRVPSLGITTTACNSSTVLCCTACVFCPITVGGRCTCCFCPIICACCSCNCTTCVPSNLSGIWKSSEQYNAKINCAWTTQTVSSSTSPTLLCCVTGQTCINVITDYYGTVYCISGSTKYIIAACRGFGTWAGRNTAVNCAQNLGGSGWGVLDFTGGCNTLQPWNPQISGEFWLNTECDGNRGHTYRAGRIYGSGKTTGRGYTAFRSTNA